MKNTLQIWKADIIEKEETLKLELLNKEALVEIARKQLITEEELLIKSKAKLQSSKTRLSELSEILEKTQNTYQQSTKILNDQLEKELQVLKKEKEVKLKELTESKENCQKRLNDKEDKLKRDILKCEDDFLNQMKTEKLKEISNLEKSIMNVLKTSNYSTISQMHTNVTEELSRRQASLTQRILKAKVDQAEFWKKFEAYLGNPN